MACVGTKEGLIQLYKIDSTGYKKLGHTRAGLSYGSITGLDVSTTAEKIIASTQTGEILTFDLSSYLERF